MFDELTQKDIDDMEAELEHRKLVLRPELLDHVKEARALGDLSENFEYYAAKKEKNANESRIRHLERMIRTAKVIEDNSSDDEVGLNKTVTVYIEEDDEEEEYKITTTVRNDPLNGIISNVSPLGKALMGKKVGDRVEVSIYEERMVDGFPKKVVVDSYFVVVRKIDSSTKDDAGTLKSY